MKIRTNDEDTIPSFVNLMSKILITLQRSDTFLAKTNSNIIPASEWCQLQIEAIALYRGCGRLCSLIKKISCASAFRAVRSRKIYTEQGKWRKGLKFAVFAIITVQVEANKVTCAFKNANSYSFIHMLHIFIYLLLCLIYYAQIQEFEFPLAYIKTHLHLQGCRFSIL